MSKRIISIFLCCALCAGFLIFPVFASSLDGSINQAGTEYLNYFVADEYRCLSDLWYPKDVASYEYSDTNRFGFKWTPQNFLAGSYMLFAVRSTKKPDAVSVRFSSSGTYTAATYEGAIPSAGNLYFYRVVMPSLPEHIEIFGRYDSLYTGTISIASCFGVRNLLSVYDRAEFTYVPIELRTEGEFIEGTYNANTQFFPYSSPAWLSSTDNISRVDYTIRADGDRFNTSAVGRVSLLITTFCETLRATVSLVAKDSSVRDVQNIKCNISTDNNWGLVNNFEVGLGTAYNYAAYQINFDLTGYDMAKYDLQIFVSVDTVNWVSEGNIGTKLFDLTFRSMQYVPTLLSNPWYKPITDFIGNVTNSIGIMSSNIAANITTGINTIKSFLNTQYNNFTSFLQTQLNTVRSNITTAINNMNRNLADWLGVSDSQKESISSSVDQNQQQQEQVDQESNQLQQDMENIQQAEDQLLQVPEINPSDLQLGTLVPSSGMTMMTNVMVTITNNAYASQILLLVVALAVVAVLIF